MLLHPDYCAEKVTDIDEKILRDLQIDGLLLDVDNTLAKHQSEKPVEGLGEWILKMQRSGIKLTIVSNNIAKRVEPFAKSVGLNYISFAMKPLWIGYMRGVKQMGIPKKRVAIVGDQIFTDVFGANCAGVRSILVKPVEFETKWTFRLRRYFERRVIRGYRKKQSRLAAKTKENTEATKE